MTPKFELGRDVCTVSKLPRQFSSSYVYSFRSYRVDKQTNKQTSLKTSNVLRYATTLGNNTVNLARHVTNKSDSLWNVIRAEMCAQTGERKLILKQLNCKEAWTLYIHKLQSFWMCACRLTLAWLFLYLDGTLYAVNGEQSVTHATQSLVLQNRLTRASLVLLSTLAKLRTPDCRSQSEHTVNSKPILAYSPDPDCDFEELCH